MRSQKGTCHAQSTFFLIDIMVHLPLGAIPTPFFFFCDRFILQFFCLESTVLLCPGAVKTQLLNLIHASNVLHLEQYLKVVANFYTA